MEHQLVEGPMSTKERVVVRGGKVLPLIQPDDLSNGTEGSEATVMSARRRRIASIFQHYYPEGGWGVVLMLAVILVQLLVHGLVLSYGVLVPKIIRRFKASVIEAGFVGGLSLSISLLISPITISFCRRKSTRLTAVLGGLVTALGCLFASFAMQFHQLVLSYGLVLGR
jgi:cyanate permease